jgi:formylglycine-generating enzyme required for sulfatase activity
MKTTEDNFISDHQFDVLLRHTLLDKEQLFNEKIFGTMAPHILSTDFTDSSSDFVAGNEKVVEKLVRDFGPNKNNFRLNIFLLSLFTVATIVLVIFFTSRTHQTTAQTNLIPVSTKENSIIETVPIVTHQETQEYPTPRTNPIMVAVLDSVKEKEDSIHPGNINNGASSPSTYTSMHIPEDHYKNYDVIPELTEEQQKQTAKDKLKILKQVGKKNFYSSLPAGATNVNGVLTPVNAFIAKDAEITNFEYRTFLNDLIMQSKLDEYLLAAPVAGGWKSLGIGEFENVYFENTAYNEFPAANMTRKGAELFCEWMTTSFREAIAKKEVKWSGTKIPKFRLPSNVEWIYAARGCDTLLVYPWGKYSQRGVQNNRGCYLCDFNYSISKDKLEHEGPPMEKNNTKGCISAKMSTRAIVTSSGRSIDTLVTCPVYSYNPNQKMLYCTMGNVAEMVWTYDAANPTVHGAARSMGGSWYSHVDNVMIEAPEQYVGVTDARAYIGFRTVMVFE